MIRILKKWLGLTTDEIVVPSISGILPDCDDLETLEARLEARRLMAGEPLR